jgi:hypothetical protein
MTTARHPRPDRGPYASRLDPHLRTTSFSTSTNAHLDIERSFIETESSRQSKGQLRVDDASWARSAR